MRTADAGWCALAAIGLGCTLGSDASVAGTTQSCTEQLASLREEMQWADSSPKYDGQLASVGQWRRSAAPAHVVALRVDEIVVDDARVAFLGSIEQDVAELAKQFPDDDVKQIRLDAERDLERRLDAGLKKALAPLAEQSIALAIEPSVPWELVAPTLRVLSRHGGVVHLLVGMPFPPWWSSRLFDEASRGADGLGEVSRRLSLRAAEVFATCPTALTFPDESSSTMARHVDGIEACDCRVDLAASRELLHAIATPLLAPVGVLELPVVSSGDGPSFTAEPGATWATVLPRLLAAPPPVVLPDLPAPSEIPLPPPP